MYEDNQVLIITQCEANAVTSSDIEAFSAKVGADVCHHIRVLPMSTEEFYFLIGQIHNCIQILIDERKEPGP